jgi:hypothetical protein
MLEKDEGRHGKPQLDLHQKAGPSQYNGITLRLVTRTNLQLHILPVNIQTNTFILKVTNIKKIHVLFT